MGKIKKYIPRIILLDTIICFLVLAILSLILYFFDLTFRQWVYIVFAILIGIGFIIEVIQLLLKIKNKGIKIGLIIVFIITLLITSPTLCLCAIFYYMPEHVVEKDGKQYVAYVNGFKKTYVYYYDYKNFLISGNKKKIEEYYGRGGFDPIIDACGGVVSVTYYDEEEKVLSVEIKRFIE